MTQQAPQPLDPPVQDETRPLHAPHGRLERGWHTVREIRDALRFPSDDACRTWLRRQGIVGVRRGRTILVDGLDVNAALRGN